MTHWSEDCVPETESVFEAHPENITRPIIKNERMNLVILIMNSYSFELCKIKLRIYFFASQSDIN